MMDSKNRFRIAGNGPRPFPRLPPGKAEAGLALKRLPWPGSIPLLRTVLRIQFKTDFSSPPLAARSGPFSVRG